MYELKNVKFLDILDIPYLKIKKSKVSVIVGPSGSGKSTLLKMLNKIISPSSGDIFFKGQNLKDLDSVALRREVPMLGQDVIRFDGTVRDNLELARNFQNLENLSDERLTDALKKVNLNIKLDQDIRSLSGGEMQRVAIARIALLEKEVYLMDEPSSALDKKTEDFVIKTFIESLKGKTLIFVTHSKELAEKYADDIIEVAEGKINE